jgi:hypothetical protein
LRSLFFALLDPHFSPSFPLSPPQHVLNLEHSVNFFSGHDYTLLGTICALNLVSDFKVALNFSAYLLFELWDSPPEDSALSGSCTGPVVRILLNPTPFKNPDGTASRSVQTNGMIRLKDLPLEEATSILQQLRSQTNGLEMKPLKKEKEAAPPATGAEIEIDMLS